MNKPQHKNLQIRGPAPAATLPPPMIEESAWDILLALHSDHRCDLSLTKLASIVSMSPSALHRWLAALEDRKFITGAKHGFASELRAILTQSGRLLLDRYLSASNDLQVGTSH
jgi:DNA-binding MarR family transcriptional regulator